MKSLVQHLLSLEENQAFLPLPALFQPSDFIPGTPGDDTLNGTLGADTLDGGTGADRMIGNKGDDTYIVDNIGDVVVEANKGGTGDAVFASVNYSLGDYVEHLVLTGSANLSGTGNSVGNFIAGNDGKNQLNGKSGSDTLLGGAGNDKLTGGGDVDFLYGEDGDDTLTEDEGFAYGGAGNDKLKGNGQLYGEAGNDIMTASSAGAYMDGGADNDELTGGVGSDTLDGGAGLDKVFGGDGNDMLVDSYTDADTFDGGTGNDTLHANWTMYSTPVVWHNNGTSQVVLGNKLKAIESLWLELGSGDDVISNIGGDDTILGGEGNDSLSAGDGNDQLFGWTGNDTLNGGEGFSSLHGEAGSDLLIGGSSADTLYGEGDSDTVNGNGGNDHFLEADFTGNELNGGDGIDQLSRNFQHLVAGVSFVNGVGALVLGEDTISGIEQFLVELSLGDDQFDNSAYSYADKIWGHGGNDSLNGGGGEDYIYGGTGNDTVKGQGFGSLLGEDGDDVIDSTGGNGYSLSGGAGNDTLIGGDGNEVADGGTDNDTFSLGGGDDRINWFGLDLGDDSVDGGAGIDVVTAHWEDASQDIVWHNDPEAVTTVLGHSVTGVESMGIWTGDGNDDISNLNPTTNDLMSGAGGNDTLAGGAGHDILEGGNGDDVLIGGAGNDMLQGGFGSDAFVFDSAVGSDSSSFFESGSDIFRFAQSTLVIGNGDTVIDGATTIAGPGGYASSAELVIVTGNVAGELSAEAVAAAIGSADTAFTIGQTAVFVFDNGIDTAIYRFVSLEADADVSAAELGLVASVIQTSETALGDYAFSA